MQNRTFIYVGADAVSLPSVATERRTLPKGGRCKKLQKNKIRACIICQSCVIIQPVSAMTLIEIGA